MAAPFQFGDRSRVKSPFRGHGRRGVAVRPSGIRKTPAGDPRGLNRLLRVHSELHHIEEQLGHRLALDIAAGRAKRHPQPALPESHGRIGGQARPLARPQSRRVFRIQPGLVAPGGHSKAQSGNDWRTADAIAGGGGKAVAPTIHHADVAGISFDQAGYRLRAGRHNSVAAAALVRPRIAGGGHCRASPHRIDGPPPFRRIVLV